MKKKKIYTLYKGDKWLTDGTKDELAEYLNVATRTITFYTTRTWKERSQGKSYIVIKVEDKDEES